MLKRSLIASLAALAAILLALTGCGTKSDAAPSLDAAGKHPADWLVKHRTAYRTLAAQCRACHGEIDDPTGGVVKVSCTSTSYSAFTCHFKGHTPRNLPHAIPFTNASAHGRAAKADMTFCMQCHAERISDGSLRFDMPIGLLKHGCEDCHKANTAHPPVDPAKVPGLSTSWLGHATAGNLASACTQCHGAAFGGGTGPACNTCHKRLGNGEVPDRTGNKCGSCHNAPPDGDILDFPNVKGAHLKHTNLTGITCRSCHDGGGSGTPNHGTATDQFGVKVNFLSLFTAKTGETPSFNAQPLTCRNVSCHGAIETPNWRTGEIKLKEDGFDEQGCLLCHGFKTGQYNSFGSGQHAVHVRALGSRVGLFCTECHDSAKLKLKHFVGLTTKEFEGRASATLRDKLHYTPDPDNADGTVPRTGSCFPDNDTSPNVAGCHPTKSW